MQSHTEVQYAIIGAGFGGILAALRLQASGRKSFVIFERGQEPGGTWRDNIYPGCACDIPSVLYALSSEPNPHWTKHYADQPEILAYLKAVVDRRNLGSHIHYGREIVNMRFLPESGHWLLTDQTGQTCSARMVIAALGPLNRAFIPALPGRNSFRGKQMHSSGWDPGFDVRKKRVAVVGTGASAIQIIPALSGQVDTLYVFQRTPAWVLPRFNRTLKPWTRKLFARLPWLQLAFRESIYWFQELQGLSFLGQRQVHRMATQMAIRKIRREVHDPNIRRALTPGYALGCKRVLLSDEYYPSFNRANVELITQPIQEITEGGVRTAEGREIPLDCIIWATGFTVSEFNVRTRFTGLGGRDLADEWSTSGMQAYQGITVHGFPNLAFLLGPNTGLGHNSVVHIMESQMQYIMQYIEALERVPEPGFLDVRRPVQEQYNAGLQRQFKGTVWSSGCRSWYQDARGNNTTIFPGLASRYRRQTRRLRLADYDCIRSNDALSPTGDRSITSNVSQ